MFPSSTCFIVSACLSIFIIILRQFRQVILFSVYFVTNITHLFHIIKCTLHVITRPYIVLMQNSFNVQFFRISYDKTYRLINIAHVAC